MKHPTLNLPPSISLKRMTAALADEGLRLVWRHFPRQSNIGHRPVWDRGEKREKQL